MIVKKLFGGEKSNSGSGAGAANSNSTQAYTPVSTSVPLSGNSRSSSPAKTGMNLLSHPGKAVVNNNTSTTPANNTPATTTKDTKTDDEVKKFKRMAGLDLTSNPKSKPLTTVKGKIESSSTTSSYDSLEYDNDEDEEKSHTINMDNAKNDGVNNNLIRKVDKRI